MNDENNKYLNNKYGEIIRKFEHKGEQMPFWFDCGDGWLTIIDELCASIVNHINNRKQMLDYEKQSGGAVTEADYESIKVTISQVKEKYGGLRFYTYGGDEYVQGLIDFAETMSCKICEGCGNRGTLITKGWWKTYCEPCRNDDERRHREWEQNFKRSVAQIEAEKNGG